MRRMLVAAIAVALLAPAGASARETTYGAPYTSWDEPASFGCEDTTLGTCAAWTGATQAGDVDVTVEAASIYDGAFPGTSSVTAGAGVGAIHELASPQRAVAIVVRLLIHHAEVTSTDDLFGPRVGASGGGWIDVSLATWSQRTTVVASGRADLPMEVEDGTVVEVGAYAVPRRTPELPAAAYAVTVTPTLFANVIGWGRATATLDATVLGITVLEHDA